MNLNSKHTLFGYPVLKIREILRYAMSQRLDMESQKSIVANIADILSCSIIEAKEVLKSLVDENYVTIEKKKSFQGFIHKVIATELGRKFGIARAEPSLSRDKADLLLKELLERVEEVNRNSDYAFRVQSVKVFGSYLSDKMVLGDLDVSIKLEKRYEGEAMERKEEERISLAFASGRSFPNYVEEIFWPNREVMLKLKTKKKGLSIHDEASDKVTMLTEYKTVYEWKKKNLFEKLFGK